MRKFKVTDDFKNSLQVYVFDDIKKNKGIIQLVHGINEHGMRYEEFAQFLNEKGYVVYIYDQVSQGLSRTELDKDVVYFGDNGGDVLVLRASGSDGYNDYMYTDLGITLNSVETIVFNDGSAANETYIHNKIKNAEAIWFAGGDQWSYISYWRNSPIDSLIKSVFSFK